MPNALFPSSPALPSLALSPPGPPSPPAPRIFPDAPTSTDSMVFAFHVPVLNAHISTPLPPTACDPIPLLTLIFTFVPAEFEFGFL